MRVQLLGGVGAWGSENHDGRPGATCRRKQRALSRLGGALLVALTLATGTAHTQALAPASPVQALTQYKIDQWQTEQGLPLNTVQALLQSRDGYLWVGTGGGLARFDGVRFATFESSQLPEISSQPIFGLMQDSAGTVWIGHSTGASFYRNGRFKKAFGSEATNGRRVWSFAEGRDGVLWAATENGLVEWKGRVRKVYQVADGLPTNRLRSLTFDRDGTLWLATTGGGLVSFSGGRFESFTPANGFPHLEVRSVLADPAGGVWAATAGGGLVHVDHGRIRIYGLRDGLPTDQLTALSLDDKGSLWIGTWGAGLCRLRQGSFSSISTDAGLTGGQIWSVLADREESVWVGTWTGGLDRLRNRDFVVLGVPEGLSNDNVRSVLHARSGVTWVTTGGGGVNRIEGSAITAIRKKDGLPSDETSCLSEDREGSIWVGTYTGGVARIRQGRVDTFGTSSGLPNVDVRALLQDRSGTLWAGTMSGLARFNGQTFTPIQTPGTPIEGVTSILEDRSGTLWFGTTGQGLVRYRNGAFDTLTRKDGLVSNWIMSLLEDQAGSLWIGTNGEGMNRLRNGRLSSIRTADGLWDGIVQVILDDRIGNFWMTCNRGFFRVSHAEMDAFCERRAPRVSSVGYGPGDALRSTTFAGGHQPAGAVDREGQLWLPSFSGLVIVDPSHLPGSGGPPTVLLEDVSVNGVQQPQGASVVLPPGSVPLSIRYRVTTLLNAEKVRFRYRMDGAGGGWIDAGRNREAFFPTLPHGSYEFRVAASNDGKQWREAAEPLLITVKPSLLQTSWFLALVVFLILIALGTMMRMRTRHLRQQKAEMERLVAEKTEALKLANEHLARISFVDSLTGLANRRRFDEALEEEWKRAYRFPTSLAIILADVDLFKAYNDTLGHPQGDKCLAAVADVFRHSGRRAGDLVARYGGEEFVVLIPAADHTAALAFAEKLRVDCEARGIPHPSSPVAGVVTISLGVAAAVPSDGVSSEALLAEADAALYRAKRDGRNRVA